MDVINYILSKKLKKYVDDSVGNVPDEKITEAVNTYLEENPVAPGATSEQAEQIQDNTNKISELKGDLDEVKESFGNINYKSSTTTNKAWVYNRVIENITLNKNEEMSIEISSAEPIIAGGYARLCKEDATIIKSFIITAGESLASYKYTPTENYSNAFIEFGAGSNSSISVSISVKLGENKIDKVNNILFQRASIGSVLSVKSVDGNGNANGFEYIKTNEDGSDIIVTNYGILIDEIKQNYKLVNGQEVIDTNNQYSVTSVVRLDKSKDIYVPTSAYAAFYDSNMMYISTSNNFYYSSPLTKESFPSNAEFIRFQFWNNISGGLKFYAQTFPDGIGTAKFIKFPLTILKRKNIRSVVNIYNSDTEIEIFEKLYDAYATGDCDVYFEHGTYNFDAIFELFKTRYGRSTAYELPIGGNCRYFFNGSVLKGTYTGTDENVLLNCSVLGSWRYPGGYELHDGTIIATDMVYAVHDEGSGKEEAYVNVYDNMKFFCKKINRTANTLCIGAGSGLYPTILIRDCYFDNEDRTDFGWHGHTRNDTESEMNISISNCYISNGFKCVDLGSNETAILRFNGNSVKKLPNPLTGWTIYEWGNTVRTS